MPNYTVVKQTTCKENTSLQGCQGTLIIFTEMISGRMGKRTHSVTSKGDSKSVAECQTLMAICLRGSPFEEKGIFIHSLAYSFYTELKLSNQC